MPTDPSFRPRVPLARLPWDMIHATVRPSTELPSGSGRPECAPLAPPDGTPPDVDQQLTRAWEACKE